MNTVTGLYDQDFYAWAMKNAELIRQGVVGWGEWHQDNGLVQSATAGVLFVVGTIGWLRAGLALGLFREYLVQAGSGQ